MNCRRARPALTLLTIVFAGCASNAHAPDGSGDGGHGAAGTGGGAGTGSAGSVSAGAAGSGAAGDASVGGGGGTVAGAAGTGAAGTGAAGSTGAAGTGAAGATEQAGTGGGTAGTTGQAGTGGVFVTCDDHADFNGRGRCAATGKVGAVFAYQNGAIAVARTTLTAIFGTTARPAEVPCTREAVGGSCTALTCPASSGGVAAGPQAGIITAKSNGGMVATTPNTSGVYDNTAFDGALWTLPKAALTFAAAGGSVPAFGETFCGPTPVTITKPAESPGPALHIDRASDLLVQWTGGAGGDLEVTFVDTTTMVQVQCFFVASAGQGTVPKAALAKIGAGAHAVASRLWVRKIGGASSGNCIELTAIQTNNSATGAPFNGAATYQ